jgi:hypothetical protein
MKKKTKPVRKKTRVPATKKKVKRRPQAKREASPFGEMIDMTKGAFVVGATMQVGTGALGMIGTAMKNP